MGKYTIDNFEKWAEENIDFDEDTHFIRVICNELAEANRLKRLEIIWNVEQRGYTNETLKIIEEELEDKA